MKVLRGVRVGRSPPWPVEAPVIEVSQPETFGIDARCSGSSGLQGTTAEGGTWGEWIKMGDRFWVSPRVTLGYLVPQLVRTHGHRRRGVRMWRAWRREWRSMAPATIW